MSEVLKFVTLDEGLRKKRKTVLFFFAKMTQFYDFFYLSFGLKDLF